MTLEQKKEIVKATFYEYSKEAISELCDVTEKEIDEILEENQDYLKELEARDYA